MARKHKLAGVAFTYNDPVVWIEYVHDVCAAFKEAGLYTAFITAAYLTEAALDYVAPVIDAFKFDLKAATAEGWARLTKVKDPDPGLRRGGAGQGECTGATWRWCPTSCPGLNDDDVSSQGHGRAGCARSLGPGTPWHVTRFLPDFELSYLPATPIKTLERGVTLGKAAGLRFVYVGNVQGHPARNTVCPACGRTVIRTGRAQDRRAPGRAGAVRGLRGGPGGSLRLGLGRGPARSRPSRPGHSPHGSSMPESV